MIDVEGHNVTSEAFLPKMQNQYLRKYQILRDVLQNNWSVLFKSDKVINDKVRLGEYSRLKESKKV